MERIEGPSRSRKASGWRPLMQRLSCKILDKDAFQKRMLEKLIWISAFMLVGAGHPRSTVGIVEKDYHSEVSSLITELANSAAAEKGLVFEEGMVDRLCAYARAVSHFPTAVKEFKWRNGWFYSLSEKAITQGKPDPLTLHTSMAHGALRSCKNGIVRFSAVWSLLEVHSCFLSYNF